MSSEHWIDWHEQQLVAALRLCCGQSDWSPITRLSSPGLSKWNLLAYQLTLVCGSKILLLESGIMISELDYILLFYNYITRQTLKTIFFYWFQLRSLIISSLNNMLGKQSSKSYMYLNQSRIWGHFIALTLYSDNVSSKLRPGSISNGLHSCSRWNKASVIFLCTMLSVPYMVHMFAS